MEENMYARLMRLAAKGKKDEEEIEDSNIENEESGLGHLKVPKPPDITKLDLSKMKESFNNFLDKSKDKGIDNPEQDPRTVDKAMDGPGGAVSTSLNIDTLIDLNQNMRKMITEFSATLMEWKDLYKTWNAHKKSYDASYEKLTDSLWDIAMSVRENAKSKSTTPWPRELEMAFVNAKNRAKVMDEHAEKLNSMQEKAKQIYSTITKSMDNTTGYVTNVYRNAGFSNDRVVRVLMSLYKVTPQQAAKLHLASLNATFARLESESDLAKAEVAKMRESIRKTKAQMLQKFAKDENLDLHLYDGDLELLTEMAFDLNDPKKLEQFKSLKSLEDIHALSPEEVKKDKDQQAEVDKKKQDALLGSEEVENAEGSDDSIDEIERLMKKLDKGSALKREAHGASFIQALENIESVARRLDARIDKIEQYVNGAAHQLDAMGIEVDLPDMEEAEEEIAEEGLMHAPVMASKKSNIDKNAA